MSKKEDHQIDGYFDYVVPPLEGFWWQDGVYLAVEILYPKTENVNAQMKLKPLWFGLFLILIET